ncbi:MAG: hypothetical protein U5K32_14160 [Bacteroidales bacterium]|nr:hypothetical protein [Bacteroidales bacterium]
METHNNIQKLTEKIHREGLEKAKMEADQILSRAQEEAAGIINDARKEAESIKENARKEAEDSSKKIRSELRLSSQQSILSLKKEISELVQAEVIKEPLEDAFNDKGFVRDLLSTVVSNWNACQDETDLQVLVPADKLKEVENFFREKTGRVLNKGLSVGQYNGSGNGFEIKPENGHYKINMTDEAFNRFLKEHFRPRTLDFLYGAKS